MSAQSNSQLPTQFAGGREPTAFSSIASFEVAQRMATALASSALVPESYRGNVANCLVALEVAQRCQASPLMVMQNLHLIHGRPSWASSYIIAAVNSSGRFEALRFKMTGDGDAKTCVAWTKDRTGELIEGPPVSIAMAKAEKWYDRTGSKWRTMPELMLRYRAAAFFGRLYAPEILMGMRSEDEERDVIDVTNESATAPPAGTPDSVAAINDKIRGAKKPRKAEATPAEPAAPAPEPAESPQAEASSPAPAGSVEGHF